MNVLAQDTSNADFCGLYNCIIQYEQTAINEQDLLNNTSQLQTVNSVSQASTQQAEVGIAQAILDQVNQTNYFTETFEIVTPNNSNQRLAPINEIKGNATSEVTIYPNPTKEQFTLTNNYNFEQGNVTLTIYDLMGRTMFTEMVTTKNQIINTTSLKQGVYFYHLTQNNNQLNNGKLVIE